MLADTNQNAVSECESRPFFDIGLSLSHSSWSQKTVSTYLYLLYVTQSDTKLKSSIWMWMWTMLCYWTFAIWHSRWSWLLIGYLNHWTFKIWYSDIVEICIYVIQSQKTVSTYVYLLYVMQTDTKRSIWMWISTVFFILDIRYLTICLKLVTYWIFETFNIQIWY